MATSSKLADKAAKLDFSNLPGLGGVAAAPVAADPHRPKTAPGAMMAFATDARSDLLRENEQLKTRAAAADQLQGQVTELVADLKQWDGAKAARLLDPKRVARSRWANRHELSFADAEFRQLKEELASSGGNVQPIKVRIVSRDADGDLYEIVFGHRRHQGCLELGLPVLAMIENLSDQGLFVEMDRENRARKNLSAWEQGVMYRRALNEGLFLSNRKLAEAVGVDLSALGKALVLAGLPEVVVAAFPSPLEIQFRWAKPLSDRIAQDPEAILSRARSLAAHEPKLSAKEVFEELVAAKEEGGGTVPPPPPALIEVGGKIAGKVAATRSGGVMVSIESGKLDPDRLQALAKLVGDFLSQSSRSKR